MQTLVDLSDKEQQDIILRAGADNFDRPEVIMNAFTLGVNFALTGKIPSGNVACLLKKNPT